MRLRFALLVIWFAYAGAPARAFAFSVTPLLDVSVNPSPKMECAFYLVSDAPDEIEGMLFNCSGEDLDQYGVAKPLYYNVPELERGIVLMKSSRFDRNILALSVESLFDSGFGFLKYRVHLKYLKNAITRSYGVYDAELIRWKGEWELHPLSREEQVEPVSIHHVRVRTYWLGVKAIENR